MEVLFENKYIRSKELNKEIYRYIYFFRKPLLVWDIVLLLLLILDVVMTVIGRELNSSVLIVAPLFFIYQITGYFRTIKLSEKRDRELHREDEEICLSVCDQCIWFEAPKGNNIKMEYSNVKEVIITKNLIMLSTEAKLLYIFRKDSFTIGTSEDFLIFLRRKGFYIKQSK